MIFRKKAPNPRIDSNAKAHKPQRESRS